MKSIAIAIALLAALPASAFPNLTVSYLTPAITVTPTQDVELWVHVESSEPIGSSLGAPFGFDASDLPTTATLFGSRTPIPFASYTSLSVMPGFGCSPSCDVAGYDLLSWFPANNRPLFSNLAGTEVINGDYLVSIYRPQAAQAPTGTFTIPLIPSLHFNVQGLSASGTALNAYLGPINGFAACNLNTLSSCGVKVTVAAVPEPTTLVLVTMGMAGLWATSRRSRKA